MELSEQRAGANQIFCPSNGYMNESTYSHIQDHYQDPYSSPLASSSATFQSTPTNATYSSDRMHTARMQLDYRSHHIPEHKSREQTHQQVSDMFYGQQADTASATKFQTICASDNWPAHEVYYELRGSNHQNGCTTNQSNLSEALNHSHHLQSNNGYFCAQQQETTNCIGKPIGPDTVAITSQYNANQYFCSNYNSHPTTQQSSYPITSGYDSVAPRPEINSSQPTNAPLAGYYHTPAKSGVEQTEESTRAGESLTTNSSLHSIGANFSSATLTSTAYTEACYSANNSNTQRHSTSTLTYNALPARSSGCHRDRLESVQGDWPIHFVSGSNQALHTAPAEKDAREKLSLWTNSVELDEKNQEQNASPESVETPTRENKSTNLPVDASNSNESQHKIADQTHAGRRNQCNICGRNYARPSTLKTHLRTHTNERPFKCNVCSKTFSQAANLTAHQRVHTGK